MHFQQLAYFVAVAEARHFTRAAEEVHVSQPSLSQQIKALENELGAELFSRARGNIALTDAGEALLPLARRILADADTARHEVQELVQLRRGASDSAPPRASAPACCPMCCAPSTEPTPGSSSSSRREAPTTSCDSSPGARWTSPCSCCRYPPPPPR